MSALEDSIGSSPKRCRRSIHEARLKRKLKRRRLNETLSTTFNHTNQLEDEENDWSRLLYDGDTQRMKTSQMESKSNETRVYGANFDPFADQMQLAAADRMGCRNLPTINRDHIEVSQGFRKLEDLPLRGKSFDGSESIECSQIVKVEPFDEITESELLHVCEEVEKNFMNSGSTLETPRAKHTKSIVDLILEDFCASPLTPDTHSKQIKPPEDLTPKFRFRHQPLRTYSRRRRLDVTNSVPEAPLLPKIEDDCLSSSSSNLSVEERLPVKASDNVEELEHSESFCNNLLNLSAFFTESPPKPTSQPPPIEGHEETGLTVQSIAKTQAASEPEDYPSLSGLINEIINLRQQYPVVFSKRKACARNFRGFKCADDGAESDLDSTLIAPRSIGNYSVDIVVPNTEDVVAEIEEIDAVIAAETPEMAFEAPLAVEIEAQVELVPSAPKEVCDNSLSGKSPANEDLFSENEELWDEDLDFFKNFKTQEVLQPKSRLESNKVANGTVKKETPPETNLVVGFKTASRKTIPVSKEAQRRAAKLLQDLPELNVMVEGNELDGQALDGGRVSKMFQENINFDDKKPCTSIADALPSSTAFVGFETASRKTISISKEARQRAASILQHLPELNGKIESYKRNQGDESNKNTFISAISPLQKAQASHEGINTNKGTEKRPDLPALNGFKRSEALVDDRPSTSKEASLRHFNTFMGCQRTSQKTEATSISPELPNEIENLAPAPEISHEAASFVGFRTASHKTIRVSETARKKALSILSKLPEIPNAVGNATPASPEKSPQKKPNLSGDIAAQTYFDEALKDVHLSEWPLSNESPCGKRPLRAVDDVDNLQPLKPAKYSATHNPAAPKPSLSALAVHSPLSHITTQSIIARSNLLSLSKRRKNRKTSIGADALQPTSDAVGTPNKLNSLAGQEPTTPNLQEFFSAVAQAGTSTPIAQVERGRLGQTAQTELERDFRHIEWEDSTDLSGKSDATLRQASNLSTASNRTTPTPQQRIERLLIYPEPPAVSPIAMARNSKCRRLGLQRSRTANKRSGL